MRRKLLATGAAVIALFAVLLPLSLKMENAQEHADQTAEALLEPMLDIHNQVLADREQTGVPVGDLIELEDAWAIEDTREESAEPLVTQMVNGSAPLGYDRAQNTFYCTLGLETGEVWPQLELFVKNAPEGLEIRIVDDYTYDWCSDAIREGWRYELLAYTQTEYSYFGIVFTGLPIVSLHVQDGQQIGEEYIPTRASVSATGYDTIDTAAKAHLRGGGFEKPIDKFSYRLEFHTINEKGRDKQQDLSVLGMEADSDWLLIANPGDDTCVRNHICWDMWHKWNLDGDVPMLLGSELVEVFVNDEYVGVYQLMQRVDQDKELTRMGASLDTDYVFRIIRPANIDPARAVEDYFTRASFYIELRQKPLHASDSRAFGIIDDYVKMNHVTDVISDEAFEALIEEHIDLEALISYFLFFQVVELDEDNIHNNLYIWATLKDGRYQYVLSPWDMDFGLTTKSMEERRNEMNLSMVMPRRILDLNLKGSRQMIWDLWREKRSTILTDDAVYQWIMDVEEMVNASGAYLRESQKWYGEARTLNLAHVAANSIAQMNTIEFHMNEIWPLEEK